jgi:hypothetical protein
MPRFRSVAVVALLWVAALAGSSAPDGFSGPGLAETPVVAGAAMPARIATTLDGVWDGKRWPVLGDLGVGRWS